MFEIRRYLLFCFFFLATHSYGQEKRAVDTPVFSALKGIVLIENSGMLLQGKALSEIECLQTVGCINVPGGLLKLSAVLQDYFYCPVGKEEIREITDDISSYYKTNHHPFVFLEIPKQDVSSNVLQIVVRESRLGQVKMETNGPLRSRSCALMNYIELETGEVLDQKILLRDLQFINRHSFRRVDYIYSPGEKPYTTDLTLYVEDRKPVRFYIGGDNSGVQTTGRQRWFTGVNIAYLSRLDDLLSYQYTASSDFSKFQAHTIMYMVMFPWRHLLNTYGGYSSVHARLSFPGMKNHGQSIQASQRYIVPLNPTYTLNHEASVGYDFKRTNNNIEFSSFFPTIRKNVNLTQIVGKYAGNYEQRLCRIDFNLEFFWSPGRWLPDQTNADFASLRPGAKNNWAYLRSTFVYSQKIFKNNWFFFNFRGQLSGSNLIPSEQLGIGGYDSVRGYEERQLNMDSGALLSAELRTRSLLPTPRCGRNNYSLQILGFVDFGYGANHKLEPGERKHDYLAGAGPGARLTLNNWLSGRIDWGFKLHKAPRFSGGDSMIHFQLIGSY
jgi:hemolysin activation/secretion protein